MLTDVCCVVVTYNRINLLKECIESIKNQTYNCDILVVNNNSDDSTDNYLVNKNIKHITTKENIGGAGGFNLGIKDAVLQDYKYVWLMDDDCIPNNNALEKLMDAGRTLKSNYGFLVSKAIWTDSSVHKMNKINKINKITDNIFSIKQATFVSLLVKTEIVKKIGLPIKDFFIWGDDIEFTRRIAVINNINSYYVENSIVVHKTETNNGSKIAFDSVDRINRYKYAYRNESYLYRKEGIKGIIYYVLKVLYNITRILLFSTDNKRKRLNALFVGVKEGLCFNPSIEFVS